MGKKLKVLALFDAIVPTTLDQDLGPELKTDDWKTEAGVLAALNELGHDTAHLAIFDDLDLVRQKLQTFSPDVISMCSPSRIPTSTGINRAVRAACWPPDVVAAG